MTFATMFRETRRAEGLSQDRAAATFEVSRATIQNWEAERTFPRFHELLRVAERFGWQLPWDKGRYLAWGTSRVA